MVYFFLNPFTADLYKTDKISIIMCSVKYYIRREKPLIAQRTTNITPKNFVCYYSDSKTSFDRNKNRLSPFDLLAQQIVLRKWSLKLMIKIKWQTELTLWLWNIIINIMIANLIPHAWSKQIWTWREPMTSARYISIWNTQPLIHH